MWANTLDKPLKKHRPTQGLRIGLIWSLKHSQKEGKKREWELWDTKEEKNWSQVEKKQAATTADCYLPPADEPKILTGRWSKWRKNQNPSAQADGTKKGSWWRRALGADVAPPNTNQQDERRRWGEDEEKDKGRKSRAWVEVCRTSEQKTLLLLQARN